jgi:hypothetical protein
MSKLNFEMIELEKILIDNKEDMNFITELKIAYMEKYGLFSDKVLSSEKYKLFADEYNEHLKDIIEVKGYKP